ncbi:Crp/Fnr family transcriptional regulator [Pelomonas sp. SE-A7]|uniref:Crp/Fnr family transcriptional regulator n=1 Tax=Pelomonas sp. SE-A7 TaxID=3054953 RepID=UPI00259CDB69|nr:Crp/Fnr family transcriptional regulator [Pelomonas sp. SE-A7]MDM4766710.1 Crp/Fnr family transcriptional regulator [Pelomonas sp. SE-A7]
MDSLASHNGSSQPRNSGTSPWFALLGSTAAQPPLLHQLDLLVARRQLEAGSNVLDRRLAATELVAVVEGGVGLGLLSTEGFQLERSVRAPQWLDLSSAWLGGSYVQDARALERSTVIYIPVAALRPLIQREPTLQLALMQALAQQVHRLTAATQELMHKGAEKRLAAWLLQHRPAGSNGSALLQLTERKRDIAAQLAIAPETLSRMMRELKRKGLIEVQGYRVRLLDVAGLEREAMPG